LWRTRQKTFAVQLEQDFSCSNGCLGRFKNRHNIVYAQVSGEALPADTKTAS
jgi:hypothetical protein